MEITEVRTHHLRYPLKEKFANSSVWNTSRGAYVVEGITDAGLVGWGEGSGEVKRAALEAHVIGHSPFDYAKIWQALFDDKVGPRAISGVDIALWDLMGKALEMPVYQVLGGAVCDAIPAYASGLFRKDRTDMIQTYVDEAKGYVDQGFCAMKMKIGFGRAYDVAHVTAVRNAIGDDVLLAVDANCGYDVGTAIGWRTCRL